MPSKQITDREKSASSVVAVAETQANAAHAALKDLFKLHLHKGESMPDVSLLLLLVSRALDAAKKRMVDADAAHDAEIGDDEGYRRARDEAASALNDKLVELREMLIGVYGAAAAGAILSGPTPQDPVVLSRFARDVAAALGRVKLPKPRIKGAHVDAAATAEEIEQRREALDTAIKDVAREVREAQATLDAKNQALAAYDEAFAGAATALTGLLRLAGKPELAAKVRPSSRRPGQTASDAGDAPAPVAPEK